jgi:hypothetical protein
MTIYSYIAAFRLLQVSQESNVSMRLLTTYQITVLIRLLNAEFMALYNSALCKLKNVFWERSMSSNSAGAPQLLKLSTLVLSVCLLAGYVMTELGPLYILTDRQSFLN